MVLDDQGDDVSHSDPLKQVEHLSLPGITSERDALLAENQQLRKALERIAEDAAASWISDDAREALAGDAE